MNSNNWLSFPLSPTHSSFPTHLHTPHSHHHLSLGLLNDNINHPFQINQEWNLMNSQDSNEVPKIADFLGVIKSENQSQIVSYNEIQSSDSDYIFPNNSILPVPNTTMAASTDNYDLHENASNMQSLTTLSMGSSGKRSTCETSADNSSTNTVEAVPCRRSTLDTFGQRTSIYRGVTRHRWTGRYEAHLWDNSCRREGQSRKGRQVYLGGYDKEEKAARAYDLAALKYWGTSTTTNFPINNYENEVEEMKHMTRQEFVASIRRKSSGFSRGASMYRGVTRHHQHGRWQARIGRVAGNKDLYLGTFSTEEEAAEAYDVAAIKFRGLSAVTNFEMNRYDVKSILESNSLPIGGGAAKRLKEAQALESSRKLEDLIPLCASFPYCSSSSSHFQGYPIMQQQPQSSELSQYTQDPQFHQSYIQTQVQLHEQSNSYYQNLNSQTYNSYFQNNCNNNPVLLHGWMTMGSESSLMDNNGNSNGGYQGNIGLGVLPSNSTSGNGGGSEELALVKVDYDVPSASYTGWSGESVEGSNPGLFTMWNN